MSFKLNFSTSTSMLPMQWYIRSPHPHQHPTPHPHTHTYFRIMFWLSLHLFVRLSVCLCVCFVQHNSRKLWRITTKLCSHMYLVTGSCKYHWRKSRSRNYYSVNIGVRMSIKTSKCEELVKLSRFYIQVPVQFLIKIFVKTSKWRPIWKFRNI